MGYLWTRILFQNFTQVGNQASNLKHYHKSQGGVCFDFTRDEIEISSLGRDRKFMKNPNTRQYFKLQFSRWFLIEEQHNLSVRSEMCVINSSFSSIFVKSLKISLIEVAHGKQCPFFMISYFSRHLFLV